LQQEGNPTLKWGVDGGGLLISLDGVVPTRIIGVSASCYPDPSIIKYRRSFLLAPAYLGGHRKMAVERLWLWWLFSSEVEE